MIEPGGGVDVFRAMMDDLPQAVLVVSATGEVLWTNAAGRRLQSAQRGSADALGLVTPDSRVRLATLIESALSAAGGGGLPQAVRLAAPRPDNRDGPPLWHDWHAAPLDWRGTQAVRLSAVDVTADVETHRTERLLREALDSIPDALVLFDTDDTILFFNKAYRNIFWYMPPLSVMRGRPFEDVVRLSMAPPRVVADPLARSDPEAYIAKRRRRLHNPSPEPFELYTAEGRWHLVRERRTPEGRFIGIRSDITDRKRVEERLSELVKELADSNRELEQFAYVASHDLQEPLRMVTSYLQLLERRYKGRLDDTADEFIRHAVDGATRMQRLIQDLLDYSRIGRHGRAPALVSLVPVLRQAAADLALAAQEAGAVVHLPAADPEAEVVAEPGELVRLFQNLIGNAIKYRHPDRAPAITVSIAREGTDWHVSVADNGIGIAPEHFERIFLLFQRLHGRQRYSGTGIGLAVARKIVEHAGGRIWVESTPDAGSTFHVALPAADQPAGATGVAQGS